MQGKGIESTELEELLRSLQLIEQINLPEQEDESYIDAFFTEKEKKRVESRVRGAKKAKERGLKGLQGRQGAASGRQHWSAKRKRAREYHRLIGYPRQLRNMAIKIGQEGWYDTMLRGWKRMGWDVQISLEEWNLHVEPVLKEKKAIPFTERYYSKNPTIKLENILIYGRAERTRLSVPVFDGAEWSLRQNGYIL